MQLYEVRDYLDAAIEEFTELASHCSETSNIVCDPEFETAVVKVQRSQMEGDALSLSRSGKNAVKHLLKPQELAPRAVIEEEEDVKDSWLPFVASRSARHRIRIVAWPPITLISGSLRRS